MIHPPSSAPRRVMHARGPSWSEYAGGRGDNVFSSNGMVSSHVQIQQDVSSHESGYRPRDVHSPEIPQKKGVLDKEELLPELRAKLPNLFTNRGGAAAAKCLVQQMWCEQRARLPSSDRERASIGDAEGSPHSTDQLEKRDKSIDLEANRYSIDTAEGSKQASRPPIMYTEIPTAAQTSHLVRQREQGYDQPPLPQSDESSWFHHR